ncbi:hypothetical protein D3C87_982890 [compost metagenome]
MTEIFSAGVQLYQLDTGGVGLAQVTLQAFEMPGVDDRGVVGVVPERREELRHHGLGHADEGVHRLLRDKHVVRCHAQLAGIEQLADHDLGHRVVEVRRARDDRRRLAAQFQGHRHQVLRRRAQYVFADAGGAREQQMVERLAAERLADLCAAQNDRYLFFGVHRTNQTGDQCRGVRIEFRRFDHHPVARRQSAGKPAEHHVAGHIPGRDDAHDSQGLVLHPGFTGPGLTLFRAHPLRQFGFGLLERGQWRQHFTAFGETGAAMAEIGGQGLDDFLLMIDQQTDRPVEQFTAFFKGIGFAGLEGRALFFQDRADVTARRTLDGVHHYLSCFCQDAATVGLQCTGSGCMVDHHCRGAATRIRWVAPRRWVQTRMPMALALLMAWVRRQAPSLTLMFLA